MNTTTSSASSARASATTASTGLPAATSPSTWATPAAVSAATELRDLALRRWSCSSAAERPASSSCSASAKSVRDEVVDGLGQLAAVVVVGDDDVHVDGLGVVQVGDPLDVVVGQCLLGQQHGREHARRA